MFLLLSSTFYFTSSCLSFCCFLCLSSLSQMDFFVVCFPIVTSVPSCFSIQRRCFSISFRLGLVFLNSFSFCLSKKIFICPILNDNLAWLSTLVCRVLFFLFRTLNISCHSLLACNVSAEKSTDILKEVPFQVTIFSFFLQL